VGKGVDGAALGTDDHTLDGNELGPPDGGVEGCADVVGLTVGVAVGACVLNVKSEGITYFLQRGLRKVFTETVSTTMDLPSTSIKSAWYSPCGRTTIALPFSSIEYVCESPPLLVNTNLS